MSYGPFLTLLTVFLIVAIPISSAEEPNFADVEKATNNGSKKIGASTNSGNYVSGLKAYASKDYDIAYRIFRPLAQRGHAGAQNKLGDIFYYGYGSRQKDYARAFKWFQKAALQGHSNAQFSLGIMYSLAKGHAKDETEAEKWFKKASDQNNAFAMSALGILYERQRRYALALSWYIKAAKLKNTAALFKIGYFYEYGYGLPRDTTKAIKWYRLAATKGYSRAKRALVRLGEEENR